MDGFGLAVEAWAAYELGSMDGWLPYEFVDRAVRAGFEERDEEREDGIADGTELGMDGVVGWLSDAGWMLDED